MTVRNITKTTLSALLLITGFVFFRKYYILLLSNLMNKFFHMEGYAPVIFIKLFPNNYIGSYYPKLFYFCVIVIIAARMLDAILDQKAAFGILSPYISPLIITAIISIALCIDKLNMLQLWGIFYFFIIICLHSTFKKIILHSESIDRYANLKLIKGFFVTIKDTISKAVSTGIGYFDNPLDEVIILFTSAVVLLSEIIVLISFIVYMSKYWRLIFLSHLIG
jgi:hypothetical protein